MKLISLHLRNFKGIKDFKLDTRGGDVSVYGDNATGKTTIFDAFTWLLFDKDSANRKDFEIKTLDATGQPIHGLDHEVEATIEIDGQPVTLRKVFYEKWQKKRGAAEKVFTGHSTDYFINDVPLKKTEYESRIASICDEKIFKLLTNPTYFNEQLHWQERRKILLEVCGDISDEEVIASDIRLAMLPGILKGRKLEDHRKVIMARRTEINKELERIPVRIDEAERALPDISGMGPDGIIGDIAKLKTAIQEKNQEFARLESGGEVAEKTKRLREIEAEILGLKNQQRGKYDKEIREKQSQISAARERCLKLEGDIRNLQRSNEDRKNQIQSLQAQIEKLRVDWYAINEQQFDHPDICPTCGQPLPEEKRTEALAKFNLDKAKLLEAINTEGKKLKEKAEQLQAEIESTEKKIDEAQEKLQQEQAILNELSGEIEELRRKTESQVENPTIAQKLQEKEIIEKEIAAMKAGNTEAVTKVVEELKRLHQAFEALEEAQFKIKQHEQGLKRIEELKQQERQLAEEYEKLEQELYLTEQFIRTKVKMLEEKINSKFQLARFKLFDVQINGGVVECCESLYQGVPYSGGLNNAARINVGLDIINTLAEHYGFAPPIWIDNAEAVTQLIPTRGQMIRLIVSETDKKLRVEIEKQEKKEVT